MYSVTFLMKFYKKSVPNLWHCQSFVWSLLISLFIQKNRVRFLLLKTRQRLCTLPIDAQACLFLIQFCMLVTLNLSKTWKRCSLIGQHRWCLNASWVTQGVRCKKVYFLLCHSKFYPSSVCSTRQMSHNNLHYDGSVFRMSLQKELTVTPYLA